MHNINKYYTSNTSANFDVMINTMNLQVHYLPQLTWWQYTL